MRKWLHRIWLFMIKYGPHEPRPEHYRRKADIATAVKRDGKAK